MSGVTRLAQISERVVARFAAAGRTLGTAESLTGGMIASSVADVSGASAVLMGGNQSYLEKHFGLDGEGVARRVRQELGRA